MLAIRIIFHKAEYIAKEKTGIGISLSFYINTR